MVIIVSTRESVILDSEIVVLNQIGLPDFQKHQRRMNVESATEIRALSCKVPATYYVFDILYLDDRPSGITSSITEKDIVRYSCC